MIVHEIHLLIMKLLADPDSFTLAQMRDLEGKFSVYEKAKAMGLDMDLIDDGAMIEVGQTQDH